MKLTIKNTDAEPILSYQVLEFKHEDLMRNLRDRRTDKTTMFIGLENGGTLIIGSDIIEKSIIEISHETRK